MDTRSNFQTINEKEGILHFENRLIGALINIPTREIKNVRENFPDITITLKGNKKIRVCGRNLATKVYSNFLKTLRYHEVTNKMRNNAKVQPKHFVASED